MSVIKVYGFQINIIIELVKLKNNYVPSYIKDVEINHYLENVYKKKKTIQRICFNKLFLAHD